MTSKHASLPLTLSFYNPGPDTQGLSKRPHTPHLLNMPTYAGNRKDDKINPTPITPVVTGIDYPSIEDASTARESYRPPRPKGRGFYNHPNIGGSTIEDVEPPADAQSLDLIWGTIRQEKEKKMAKEKPKVQSLEEMVQEMVIEQTPMAVPLESPPMSAPKTARRHKSM